MYLVVLVAFQIFHHIFLFKPTKMGWREGSYIYIGGVSIKRLTGGTVIIHMCWCHCLNKKNFYIFSRLFVRKSIYHDTFNLSFNVQYYYIIKYIVRLYIRNICQDSSTCTNMLIRYPSDYAS